MAKARRTPTSRPRSSSSRAIPCSTRTVTRLESEPHPAFVERDDLVSQLKRSLHLSHSEPLPYQTLIDDAAKQVKVKPLGLTRLVEITCDSWSPDFSARFCNALTQEFKDEDLEVRSTEAQRTSEWLTRQVADVRLKAEESQKKTRARDRRKWPPLQP